MWIRRAQKIFRAVKITRMILERWMPVIMNFFKPIECATPRLNRNVNCGLWGILVFQHRVVSFNKCSALVGSVDNGEARHAWGQGIPLSLPLHLV